MFCLILDNSVVCLFCFFLCGGYKMLLFVLFMFSIVSVGWQLLVMLFFCGGFVFCLVLKCCLGCCFLVV